jgi:hypothetical protein
MPLILGTNSIKDTGYNVANSLRFNSGSSDSLDRTVSSSPTNPDKFTISVWVKRSKLGSEQAIIGQYSSSNFRAKIDFLADDRIEYIQKNDGNTSANIITTRKFRDPSAWIHIVFQYDSTQGTDSNRIKLYFNGTQETSFDATSYPAQNLDGKLNIEPLTFFFLDHLLSLFVNNLISLLTRSISDKKDSNSCLFRSFFKAT